jgi:hypothetical protein
MTMFIHGTLRLNMRCHDELFKKSAAKQHVQFWLIGSAEQKPHSSSHAHTVGWVSA